MSNNSLPALLYLFCIFRDMGLSIYLLPFCMIWMWPGQPCGEVPITNRDIDWIDNCVNGFQWDAINHQRPNNNTFRTQRDISSWYVAFGYQDGKVGSCLVNNPTPCKIVQTSGKMAGSHIDRAVTAFHWIANGEMSFDVNLIFLFFIPVLLHVIRFKLFFLKSYTERMHFLIKPTVNR